MITKIFTESIKSLFLRSCSASQILNESTTLLGMVFTAAIAITSLILAEISFGLSIYKALNFEYKFSEWVSMLIITLMYAAQVIISILISRHCLKKTVKENIAIRDYKLIKGTLSALIEGYKSK